MSKLSSPTNKRTTRDKTGAASVQDVVERRAPSNVTTDSEARRAMIAEAAYYRAERRGFAPGFEMDDWLQSESELAAHALQKTTHGGAELH
jgi:hypothetical protein